MAAQGESPFHGDGEGIMMPEQVQIQQIHDHMDIDVAHHHPAVVGPDLVYEETHHTPTDEGSHKADVEALENGIEEGAGKRQKIKEGSFVSLRLNGQQWDSMFKRLQAYKEQHQDCLVPKRYAADPKLGTWVETQRVQYKRLVRQVDQETGVESVIPNKRLDQKRLDKLESIGFAWTAKGRKVKPVFGGVPGGDVRPKKPPPGEENRPLASGRGGRQSDSNWEDMYLRLSQYKAQHGDCLVPRKYAADPKLASWVEAQRVLWNRDYRQASDLPEIIPPAEQPMNYSDHRSQCAAEIPPPPLHLVSGEDKESSGSDVGWEDNVAKHPAAVTHLEGGATAEDAAELAATMDEAVVEAAEAAAAEAVDSSLCEPPLSEPVAAAFGLPAREESPPKGTQKRLTTERKQRLDSLGFVWSLRSKRIDDHWDEMFRQLSDYKAENGDCLVPSRYEANLKLGKWVETQRYEYTKLQRAQSDPALQAEGACVAGGPASNKPRGSNPRLTEDRLLRLESIGFEWKVKHKMKRYYDKQWDQMFDRLMQFRSQTGNCMVPKRYPPDLKLGTWVHTQRIQYRKLNSCGKGEPAIPDSELARGEDEVSYRLTDDRLKRLEKIGFIWSARDGEKGSEQGRNTRNSYDDQWDSMFMRLEDYRTRHGDCLVPKRYKEDAKLGTWVDTQRVQYKKMKKKMAGEESAAGTKTADEKESGIGSLSDGPAPSGKPSFGRLTNERIQRLEAIGFVWSLRDDWQKHYEELIAYKQIHGHCNVPARYAANRRLGIWVSAQRQQYKILQSQDPAKAKRSAPLTQERIALLNKINFTWTIRSRDSLGESWNQRLQDLRVYKATHGDCLVPSRYPDNPELGVWVGTQRTQYRLFIKSKESGNPVPGAFAMSDYRIRQLEELGFVWALKTTPDAAEGEPVEQEQGLASALPSSIESPAPEYRLADNDRPPGSDAI